MAEGDRQALGPARRAAAPGREGREQLRSQVLYLDLLSQSLRARADRGNDPAGLGRADIEFFLARAARKEHLGEISAHKRRQVIITAGASSSAAVSSG